MNHKPFCIIVISLNAIDLSFAIYIIILCVADVYYWGNFTLYEKEWRSSIICFSAFAIVLNFSLLSPFLLCFLSYTRLMCVINPLDLKRKDSIHILRWICTFFIMFIIFATIITIVMKYLQSEIPLHICSPFVDPSNSVILIKIITWSTVIFQFFAIIFIILVYTLLFQTLKISQQYLHVKISSKRNLSSLLIQLLIITGSNILCWIPAGCIYLTFMFLEKYPIDMVIWITVLITPFNSIISPIVFILTTKYK